MNRIIACAYEKESNELSKTSERVLSYLKDIVSFYEEKYQPYIKFNKELWANENYFARKKYEKAHIGDLMNYNAYRETLKSKIKEPFKKITLGAW